jgi:hypothetical protein
MKERIYIQQMLLDTLDICAHTQNLDPLVKPYTKIISEWIKYLNVRPHTKPTERQLMKNTYSLGHIFFVRTGA